MADIQATFNINELQIDKLNKSITLYFNYDIDPESITEDSAYLFNKLTRARATAQVTAVESTIIIELDQWPTPNQEYILQVQGIKNIMGTELSSGLSRRITFTSTITSEIAITHPMNFEALEEIEITWDEVYIGTPLNKYKLQISDDNAFYNIVVDTDVIGQRSAELQNISNGQYYARCRAQDGEEYGKWSETVTFRFGPEAHEPIEVWDEPIFVEELLVMSTPENGVTPDKFIIEFDSAIDIDSIENITITRRDI